MDTRSEIDGMSIDTSAPNDDPGSKVSSPRGSVEDPLLPRRLSSSSSYGQTRRHDARLNHKIHIESEDLTVVIAGFSTDLTGLLMYIILCVLTLGLACLVFRWFPRWRVGLVGRPTRLQTCQWVAIEVIPILLSLLIINVIVVTNAAQDQRNQFSVYEVFEQKYGRPLSTIFASPEICSTDEDNDPTIPLLRFVEYRYLRFFYHPILDRFCLVSGWRDPLWTNSKVMRNGLDADDRDSREQIFGKNLLDIQQKSSGQLLVDEVSPKVLTLRNQLSHVWRHSTRFISSNLRASSFGQWTNITTMLFVYSSFLSSV